MNLCLQDIARGSSCIKEALNFAMELIQLIKYSPKRQVLFETVQRQQDCSTNCGIRTICPTRWTVRTGAMQSILNNYESLQETMETASHHGSDDCSRRASGIFALMEKFKTYFGLKLSVFIFSITENLSVTLQGVDTNVDDCFTAVNASIEALNNYRNDEHFTKFFESVKSAAEDKCDPPVLPRQRRIPRRLNDGTSQHQFTTVEDVYRKEYFEVIDAVKGELERRFRQQNFLFAQTVEKLLLDSANGKSVAITEKIQEMYNGDIDMQKLKLHLQMLPDVIKCSLLDGISIKKVTRVHTICQVLNENPTCKTLLSEVHKLLKLYYTIPVTTSSAERNFSALKRIKTYLRSSMTQSRLNHCVLLHVHQDKTDELDLHTIAKEFVQINERRINFFGKY